MAVVLGDDTAVAEGSAPLTRRTVLDNALQRQADEYDRSAGTVSPYVGTPVADWSSYLD